MNVEVLVRNTTKEAFELGLKLIALDEVPFQGQFKCNGYKIIDNRFKIAGERIYEIKNIGQTCDSGGCLA